MKHGVRDYWSFIEKIQDATDYVQELLTENSRLRRRMADLERQKEELAEELDRLRQMLDRRRPREERLQRYRQNSAADVSGLHDALSERSLRLAH